MPSGGARLRSGPAPDPSALRRDRDAGQWTTLPVEGRRGRTPRWPLEPRPNRRESVVWRRMWRTPQAIMWEKARQTDEVAFYVRTFVEAEARYEQVNRRTLLRQLSDDLGLSSAGAARLKWKIAGDQVEKKRAERTAAAGVERAPSARDRMRVVAGAEGT